MSSVGLKTKQGEVSLKTKASVVVSDVRAAMTVRAFNEASSEVADLRADVEEARRRLQDGTVEEKRAARSDLTSAKSALSKAEGVIASVAGALEFRMSWDLIPTGDLPLIERWIVENDRGPTELTFRDMWGLDAMTPPMAAASLAKVKWDVWRPYLVTACLDPLFEPKRARGVIGTDVGYTRGPYGAMNEVSAKAKAMFTVLRARVRLDATTGALYYLYYEGEDLHKKRILADETEKRQVFLKYWHDSEVCTHRGRDTTFEKLSAAFYNITRAEVEMLIRETEVYQVSSKTKNPEKVTNPLVTSRPMEHLQMDLVDFHQYARENYNYTFLLVVVDCFSKFLWAFPLKHKEAPEVLSKLRGLFMTEGIPTILQSDNGKEFVANESQEYYKKCGIVFRTGRAYKPSSQGQVERTNRTLKQAIYHDILTSEDYNWVRDLDLRVFAYNTMTQTSAGRTPFEIHRGRKMTWMSDAKDRTFDVATSIVDEIGSGRPLSEAEKALIAADERQLVALSRGEVVPEIVRDYAALTTSIPRVYEVSTLAPIMEEASANEMEEEEEEEYVNEMAPVEEAEEERETGPCLPDEVQNPVTGKCETRGRGNRQRKKKRDTDYEYGSTPKKKKK